MVNRRRAPHNRTRETVLNTELAKELRDRRLDAEAEVGQATGHQIDVLVRLGGARIAIEAEHGQSTTKRNEAASDAKRRLPADQGHVDVAIAVCYPDDTDRVTLAGSRLVWQLHDGATEEDENWRSGTLDDLASVIRLAPAQLGTPDFAAAALSQSLDGALVRLAESEKRSLAHTLDLPASRTGKNRWDTPAKRALLVLATATMFHSRLDSHLGSVRPETDNKTGQPFTGSWPPEHAQHCAERTDIIGAFGRAWDLILALDYKPIFETGIAALHACPPSHGFATAVRETARAALAVVANIAGMRHDLLGRIFHTVLDSARYDGSFYTTTAAATLLATLAIREDMCDWNDPQAVENLRIIDPACGTGTLLMSAAERIRDIAPQADAQQDLSRRLIENVLTGYDVNLTATHMAATTLGLLSPSTQFRNMKIAQTLLGVDDVRQARLGSLEFLGDKQPHLIEFPGATPRSSQVDSGEDVLPLEPADLVIMNPPYTRDSLRHDQFDSETEKKLKQREKQLFDKTPAQRSGNSGPFLWLANFLAKRDSGTVAVVLPLASLTQISGEEMRKYFAQRFHVETIVTSHDPERIYFSENTDIGEVLVVFRRWPSASESKPPTKVVNLARNPSTPADAMNLARAIGSDTVASQGIGTVQEWPAARIADGDWGAVQFFSPFLVEQFAALRRGELFDCAPLGDVADIGPDGRNVRGIFDRTSMPTRDGMRALWRHETDRIQSMSAVSDVHIAAKPNREDAARRLWAQRGRLMLPTRVWLVTVRTVSVRLGAAAVGSAWVPCHPQIDGLDGRDVEKSLCAYLNSTVGILALLGDRSNKKPGYPRFSMDDLRKIPVPNFARMGSNVVTRLATVFDQLSRQTLLPLPSITQDETRHALDQVVCEALGVDMEDVQVIRRHLAQEPSITNKRYEGRAPA